MKKRPVLSHKKPAKHVLVFPRKKNRHNRPASVIKNKTFEDFITNAKNAFPLELAKKVATQSFGESYNPFIVCGTGCTGKTYLLEIIATALAKKTKKILFQNAAKFCSENSIILQRPEFFWQHYNILILDDIHEIVQNSSWQQQLALYIDTCLHFTENCQMIFSCAGYTNALHIFEERLRSRLEQGLIVELTKPDMEIRLRYIQLLCKQNKIALSKEQRLFLAQRYTGFRLLYGIFSKIKAFNTIYKKLPTLQDIENIICSEGTTISQNYQNIIEKTAYVFNIHVEDIMHGKRHPNIVIARQVAMYICRSHLKFSYAELGKFFGDKDHSTVLYAVNKIKKLLVNNKNMHTIITNLEQQIF
jgi:chromosomal replication initiator protein